MADPEIANLLALQECDARCSHIEDQLRTIPLEIAGYERKIEASEANLESVRDAVRRLEIRRKELDTDVAGAEEQISRYKNQQLQVKKNDEYKALEHQIAQEQEKISGFEDEELEIMIEIDEKTAELEDVIGLTEKEIADFRRHIGILEQSAEKDRAELASAQAAVAAAQAEVDAAYLRNYDYVKTRIKKPPYVVPLQGTQCSGCHLKISGETESGVRSPNEITRCENCGRILYFERM